jgi:hypothetical protein
MGLKNSSILKILIVFLEKKNIYIRMREKGKNLNRIFERNGNLEKEEGEL